MNFKAYLKHSIGIILLNIVGLLFLCVFLFSVGNVFKSIMLIALIWNSVLIIYLVSSYRKRKIHLDYIENCISNIDKKYLISEVLEVPSFLEAKPYYYLLKKSSKAMREEINKEKSK